VEIALRSRLPLNGLRAFEAAARNKSFAKAADELGVTPAAVSQQVQKLEALVGTPLLFRTTRSVTLTERADHALSHVSGAFEMLERAMTELMNANPSNLVTVSATPSFSSCWLLPRLEQFQDRHPDITVRVDARNDHVDFQRDGVDIAIRHGAGQYTGLQSELMIADTALVVGSPAISERVGQLSNLEDLMGYPLLHVDWRMQERAAPTWKRWFEFHGVTDVDVDIGMRFSMEEHAIKASIAGMGLALATRAFVHDDLKAGRLVRILPDHFDMPTTFHHFLVTPNTGEPRRSVRKIKKWLRDEANLFNQPH
jgi:LysR family glycine cleavage system transcriptional activator